MSTTTEHEKANAKNPAKEMLVRNTCDVLRAFKECSDEIQQGVLEMAHILSDGSATEDEKAAAEDTLLEALYPQYVGEELGIDSDDYEAVNRKHSPKIEDELDQQESGFAERLASLMKEKGMTQAQLAEKAGVGQPAISMMLSRNCRPQRRTIQKLATALGATIEHLWPGYERE
jgi:lambda repressor-like predicted transcriptional regulator